MYDSLILHHCGLCLKQGLRFYQSSTLARITVPHRMIQRIEKEKLKLAVREAERKPRKHSGKLVISCKRPAFNHHYGQTYSNFKPENLASHGWKHGKSRGDQFTIHAYKSNPALDVKDEDNVQSFSEFGFNQPLVKSLNELGIVKPTNIQALAIPRILQRENVICAAETGSGKTMAYLLPMLENLYRYNRLNGPTEEMNKPIGIIVTPARELATQVHNVLESIGPAIGCRSHLVIGGSGTQRILKWKPKKPLDILISTPGVLSKMLTNRLYDLGRISNIVLDEADTLLDDSFCPLTLRLIRKMNVASERAEDVHNNESVVGTQLSLVSATMPTRLDEIIKEIIPEETLERVTTNHLHRLMPHVPQKFVRLGPSQRPDEIKKIVKHNDKRNIPTIIFCNKSSTACYLGYILDDENIKNVILHANMPQAIRATSFDRFVAGEANVLIATDVGSRGLDTNKVQHVINYEFPNFMSDYIHRVGRVGRVNSPSGCFVLNFVTYKWDVDLLWSIESAARRITDLHNVNANIKRKLLGNHERKMIQQGEFLGE